MTKHTPGPWEAKSAFINNAPNRWIVSGKGWGSPNIADCGEDGEANARLIAATPKLLEAAKCAMELVRIARQYFPKSIKNSDKFKLETTCASLETAIAEATNQ